MSKSKKFVVWDWNGTLLNDAGTVLECINLVLNKFSCTPLSMDVFRNIQVRSMEELYRDAGVPKSKLAEILKCDREIFHDNYESRATYVPLRDGATDLLRSLKTANVSNVILSNHIANQIVRLLKLHKIHHLFDDVLAFISREKQFKDKTKGERLGSYLDDKKLNPSNALIIGDTFEEIEIARKFGMECVSITGGLVSEKRLRATKPDHVVHSMSDIRTILKQRGFLS